METSSGHQVSHMEWQGKHTKGKESSPLRFFLFRKGAWYKKIIMTTLFTKTFKQYSKDAQDVCHTSFRETAFTQLFFFIINIIRRKCKVLLYD